MCKICLRNKTHGPGSHLRLLLSTADSALSLFGLTLKSEGCQCDRRAAEMDANGVEWCKDNEDTIVEWLRESAQNTNIPFLEFLARQLIREAIRRAER